MSIERIALLVYFALLLILDGHDSPTHQNHHHHHHDVFLFVHAQQSQDEIAPPFVSSLSSSTASQTTSTLISSMVDLRLLLGSGVVVTQTSAASSSPSASAPCDTSFVSSLPPEVNTGGFTAFDCSQRRYSPPPCTVSITSFHFQPSGSVRAVVFDLSKLATHCIGLGVSSASSTASEGTTTLHVIDELRVVVRLHLSFGTARDADLVVAALNTTRIMHHLMHECKRKPTYVARLFVSAEVVLQDLHLHNSRIAVSGSNAARSDIFSSSSTSDSVCSVFFKPAVESVHHSIYVRNNVIDTDIGTASALFTNRSDVVMSAIAVDSTRLRRPSPWERDAMGNQLSGIDSQMNATAVFGIGLFNLYNTTLTLSVASNSISIHTLNTLDAPVVGVAACWNCELSSSPSSSTFSNILRTSIYITNNSISVRNSSFSSSSAQILQKRLHSSAAISFRCVVLRDVSILAMLNNTLTMHCVGARHCAGIDLSDASQYTFEGAGASFVLANNTIITLASARAWNVRFSDMELKLLHGGVSRISGNLFSVDALSEGVNLFYYRVTETMAHNSESRISNNTINMTLSGVANVRYHMSSVAILDFSQRVLERNVMWGFAMPVNYYYTQTDVSVYHHSRDVVQYNTFSAIGTTLNAYNFNARQSPKRVTNRSVDIWQYNTLTAISPLHAVINHEFHIDSPKTISLNSYDIIQGNVMFATAKEHIYNIVMYENSGLSVSDGSYQLIQYNSLTVKGGERWVINIHINTGSNLALQGNLREPFVNKGSGSARRRSDYRERTRDGGAGWIIRGNRMINLANSNAARHFMWDDLAHLSFTVKREWYNASKADDAPQPRQVTPSLCDTKDQIPDDIRLTSSNTTVGPVRWIVSDNILLTHDGGLSQFFRAKVNRGGLLTSLPPSGTEAFFEPFPTADEAKLSLPWAEVRCNSLGLIHPNGTINADSLKTMRPSDVLPTGYFQLFEGSSCGECSVHYSCFPKGNSGSGTCVGKSVLYDVPFQVDLASISAPWHPNFQNDLNNNNRSFFDPSVALASLLPNTLDVVGSLQRQRSNPFTTAKLTACRCVCEGQSAESSARVDRLIDLWLTSSTSPQVETHPDWDPLLEMQCSDMPSLERKTVRQIADPFDLLLQRPFDRPSRTATKVFRTASRTLAPRRPVTQTRRIDVTTNTTATVTPLPPPPPSPTVPTTHRLNDTASPSPPISSSTLLPPPQRERTKTRSASPLLIDAGRPSSPQSLFESLGPLKEGGGATALLVTATALALSARGIGPAVTARLPRTVALAQLLCRPGAKLELEAPSYLELPFQWPHWQSNVVSASQEEEYSRLTTGVLCCVALTALTVLVAFGCYKQMRTDQEVEEKANANTGDGSTATSQRRGSRLTSAFITIVTTSGMLLPSYFGVNVLAYSSMVLLRVASLPPLHIIVHLCCALGAVALQALVLLWPAITGPNRCVDERAAAQEEDIDNNDKKLDRSVHLQATVTSSPAESASNARFIAVYGAAFDGMRRPFPGIVAVRAYSAVEVFLSSAVVVIAAFPETSLTSCKMRVVGSFVCLLTLLLYYVVCHPLAVRFELGFAVVNCLLQLVATLALAIAIFSEPSFQDSSSADAVEDAALYSLVGSCLLMVVQPVVALLVEWQSRRRRRNNSDRIKGRGLLAPSPPLPHHANNDGRTADVNDGATPSSFSPQQLPNNNSHDRAGLDVPLLCAVELQHKRADER